MVKRCSKCGGFFTIFDDVYYEYDKMICVACYKTIEGKKKESCYPQIIDSAAYSVQGSSYVIGVVKNVGNYNIENIKTKATLYDASDNIIETNTSIYPPSNHLIEPQKTVAFIVYFLHQPYYHHYELKVKDYELAKRSPYNGLKIKDEYIKTLTSTDLEFGVAIKNEGPRVIHHMDMGISFYDSKGHIKYYTHLDSNSNPLYGTLYSGQEKSLKIKINNEDFSGSIQDIKSYKIDISLLKTKN